MRRITLFLACVLFSTLVGSAQNYIVVDSEKIFRSINSYNQALESLDELAEIYQKDVDLKFEKVESLYQNYVARKSSLSQESRQSYENQILKSEAEAVEYQDSIFSEDGALFKRRIELIAPIQESVFSAIKSYAEANGFDMVMDLASNPTMLYYNPSVDRSNEIIELLKN